jgi:hypothetical protein
MGGLVGLLWGAVAEPADQPLGVGVSEADHALAELVDGVVQLRPQVLPFEGADPALGAAVGLRLAKERGVIGDPQPADGAVEVRRAVSYFLVSEFE